MKIILITLFLLLAGSIIALFVLGLMSRTGNAPGLTDGNLSRCANKPNCVCSEYADIDEENIKHYIKPIIIPKHVTHEMLPMIKKIIIEMGGNIQTENAHYMSATFSSAIFGFVDDFEIRFDQDNETLHLRSASRVGYGDRGVNKKRSNLFKKRLNENFQILK